MLTNFHTHTTFCDGRNTAEEIIIEAIERGFFSIGFSGHGYTPYDVRYCMTDTEGYIREILRLKEKYGAKIEIYLGIEEDSRNPQSRGDFDYIIGSCHYAAVGNDILPFDSNYEKFERALELFCGDEIEFAQSYYSHFTEYIKSRRPDIIGHFDLITKFEEKGAARFFSNEKYLRIAEKYTKEALRADSIFEVNTGLISRGYRTAPCPDERLLHVILRGGGKLTLSSDSHAKETLSFGFEETRKYLYDIGFRYTYALRGGEWIKDYI